MKVLQEVNKICDKYKEYDYIDADLSKHRIKSIDEFERQRGGICWDFISPISHHLISRNIIHHCYFTEVQKDNKTISTHTYIIVRDGSFYYWIECAWQKYKGVNLVFSYKDIERLLKEEYNADEVHTVVYDPNAVEGNTADEFFEYLNKEGIELT